MDQRMDVSGSGTSDAQGDFKGTSRQSGESAFRLKDLSGRYGSAKIWQVTFDLPGEKVNKFNKRVMDDFGALIQDLERLAKDGKIDSLVVISGKPGIFIAGADIELIQAARTAADAEALSRAGQKLLDRWEDLPFAKVAAINGVALGGGCEFSLACDAIVMSNDPAARIGLPEVMLGVIPGMGGCVRLPRKVGLATALDLILTSKNLNGERAFKAGLAEACLPKENFEESVVQWTLARSEDLKQGKRIALEPKLGGMGGVVGSALEKTGIGRGIMLKKAREGVMSKTRGNYPAPLEAITVLGQTGGTYGAKIRGEARERAMSREAQGFGKAAATDVSKNLIRLFFLTEAVKKSQGLPAGVSVPAYQPIKTGAVLGAGVMGGGIAQLFADKGISARMKDLSNAALALGIQSASKIFSRQLKKRRINRRQYMQKLNHIAPVTDYSGFQSSRIVVEAIVENLEIKQKVLKELEGQVKDDCVIASNTSSLSVSKMQSVMSRPERFGGMHFFNPVHKMPLVEVIRGDKTSDQTVAEIFQFSKQLGKTPIVVKDAPGFLVNRLLAPYLNEATYCLADGAPIDEIDRALLDFGMPMGPMELVDEVGVDVAEKVAHILNDAFGTRMPPAPLNAKVVAAKRLGKKNGKGLYEYGAEGRDRNLNPEIYTILGVSPQPGKLAAEEIVERCILPMINEASRCLEERVVADANDVDLGMIMGTGFPPFRGGLLQYADTLGAKTIVDRLRKYQARFGERFEPAPALLKRAESGQTFHVRGSTGK